MVRGSKKFHRRTLVTLARSSHHFLRQHIPARLTLQILCEKLPPFFISDFAEFLSLQQHYR